MENNQLESTNNSALGEFSVLTPSQKRALEQAEEEKRQKEAAKQERRRLNAEKKKEREKIARRWQIFEKSVAPIIIMIAGIVLAIAGFASETPGLGFYGLILVFSALIWIMVVYSKYKM